MSSALTQNGEGNGWATARMAAVAQASAIERYEADARKGSARMSVRARPRRWRAREPGTRLSCSVEVLEVALDFAEHGYVAIVFRGPLLELRRLWLAVEQLKPEIELGQ
jgi:hypothetical protein